MNSTPPAGLTLERPRTRQGFYPALLPKHQRNLPEAYQDARDAYGHAATVAGRALNIAMQAISSRIDTRGPGDALVLSVRDDGKGFDVTSVEEAYAQRGSLGLLNMKERAEIARGKLTIDSKIGKGTKVILALPLKPPSESNGN